MTKFISPTYSLSLPLSGNLYNTPWLYHIIAEIYTLYIRNVQSENLNILCNNKKYIFTSESYNEVISRY